MHRIIYIMVLLLLLPHMAIADQSADTLLLKAEIAAMEGNFTQAAEFTLKKYQKVSEEHKKEIAVLHRYYLNRAA